VVGLVVLVVVGHEVAQGEAVVGGDEVDRRARAAAVRLVQVARAGEAVGELRQGLVDPAPEVADRVAVAAVPLRPQRREVADLVAALADVPRLRDQLRLADHRVLLDHLEEGRQPVDVVQLAGERRREVEPEPVDVHLLDPVAQRVHDQLQHVGLAHVHRVAGPRVVHVVAGIVVHQAVVRGVVEALHRDRRTEVVALRGVVVDHVEDHLDARGVEVLDHLLELGDRPQPGRARVLRVRCEVGDRVVAPVVGQAALDEVVLVEVVVDGQQLDRGDAEVAEVADDGRVREAGVGPAQVLGDVRVRHRETLHVGLVDHRLRPGGPCGGRSLPQSNQGVVTTDRGT
jgi:hypothetical protein